MYFGLRTVRKFLYLPEKEIEHFKIGQQVPAIKFLGQNPHAILVASSGEVKKLKRYLGPKLLFEKAEEHRKLYTTRSESAVFASPTKIHLLQLLDPAKRKFVRASWKGIWHWRRDDRL